MAVADAIQGTAEVGRATLSLSFIRRNAVPLIALGWVILVAGIAPFVIPHDPAGQDLRSTFIPPVWQDGGSWSHPLGTDHLGRDMLARAAEGSRASFYASFFGVAFAAIVGTILALLAGYLGGVVDAVIGRLIEVVMAFPALVLALILVTVIKPSLTTVILIAAMVLWVGYARIIRGEILVLKSADFVEYARVSGVPIWKVMARHLLPNVLNSVIVLATLQLGTMIIFESTLSFLGLGISPPAVSWGLMLAGGRDYIAVAWWLSVVPGVMIVITVLLMNWTGEWVRDRLDPRLRQLR